MGIYGQAANPLYITFPGLSALHRLTQPDQAIFTILLLRFAAVAIWLRDYVCVTPMCHRLTDRMPALPCRLVGDDRSSATLDRAPTSRAPMACYYTPSATYAQRCA